MTYYSDLSPYTYITPETNTVNVGWLDNVHPFETGEVPDLFSVNLEIFMNHLVHYWCFGSHECELCNGVFYQGEIRVFGENRRIYAAPSMIEHYILEHKYLPPDEFVKAVVNGPLPNTVQYRNLAQNCSWRDFIAEWPSSTE